jgi:hypothetical protein
MAGTEGEVYQFHPKSLIMNASSEQTPREPMLDLAAYRRGQHPIVAQSGRLEDVPTAPAGNDSNSWLPKFDMPSSANNAGDRQFRDSGANDTMICRATDGLPICDDARFSLPNLVPGKNHHLHDAEAQKVGEYLEELLREGKYDEVKTALKVLADHLAPESMVVVGRAFQDANAIDRTPGSLTGDVPQVSVDTNGSSSLADIKLKDFHHKHSTSTLSDMIWNEYTVYGG